MTLTEKILKMQMNRVIIMLLGWFLCFFKLLLSRPDASVELSIVTFSMCYQMVIVTSESIILFHCEGYLFYCKCRPVSCLLALSLSLPGPSHLHYGCSFSLKTIHRRLYPKNFEHPVVFYLTDPYVN